MSDETTRPEDEVEAHGPFAGESPTMDSPTMDRTSDDDVEAHGPFAGESPTMDAPTLDIVME